MRLFPAFWCAVILTSLAAQVWGTGNLDVSLKQFLANLTMFPRYFGENYVDGVYWTLQYEWKFYLAVFAVLLFLGPRGLRRLLVVWPLYIAADHFFLQKGWALANGYYAYFAVGALFAVIRENRHIFYIGMLLLAFMVSLDFSLTNAARMSERNETAYSPVIVTALICCIFLFFTLLGSSRVRDLSLPKAGLLGSLSYPLYLVHAHLGYMLLSEFATEENKTFAYFGVMSTALLIAYLIHTLVERRGVLLWRQTFKLFVERPVNDILRIASRWFPWIRYS